MLYRNCDQHIVLPSQLNSSWLLTTESFLLVKAQLWKLWTFGCQWFACAPSDYGCRRCKINICRHFFFCKIRQRWLTFATFVRPPYDTEWKYFDCKLLNTAWGPPSFCLCICRKTFKCDLVVSMVDPKSRHMQSPSPFSPAAWVAKCWLVGLRHGGWFAGAPSYERNLPLTLVWNKNWRKNRRLSLSSNLWTDIEFSQNITEH